MLNAYMGTLCRSSKKLDPIKCKIISKIREHVIYIETEVK